MKIKFSARETQELREALAIRARDGTEGDEHLVAIDDEGIATIRLVANREWMDPILILVEPETFGNADRLLPRANLEWQGTTIAAEIEYNSVEAEAWPE